MHRFLKDLHGCKDYPALDWQVFGIIDQTKENMFKNFKLKILLVTVFSLTFFSLVFHQTVLAQTSPIPTPLKPTSETPTTGIDLNLSPTFLNLRTDPGKPVSSEFKVRNNNTFTEYLRISLVKFVNSAEGTPTITDIEQGDDFANWIEFDQKEFSVGPNQSKTVKFTISPPAQAALGYYYGILVSRIQKAEGEGTVISGSTAVPVLLEVRSPNAKREVQIISFKPGKLFYEYLPVEFNAIFKNTGNVHVAPIGDIFVDSLFNEEVAVLRVNEGRGSVLPNGVRTFTATWDEGFAVRTIKTKDNVPVKDDKGNSVYETNYDFSKANLFRFGRYTANLLMVYDNGERDIPVEAKISFWVVPWKMLGIGAVIVLLALIGLRSTLMPIYRKIRGR